MKLPSYMVLTAALAAVPSAHTFSPADTSSRPGRPTVVGALEMSANRRDVLAAMGAAIAAPAPASASLLDDFGADGGKIAEQPAASAATRTAVASAAKPSGGGDFEPNLRSNYYYPTNKKRYLPRIKKCSDLIPDAAQMIGSEDWDGATDFATKIADDTVLPMKLYTSSLTGGGTNVKVSFTKDMMKQANEFEKAQKKLVKALAKKDQEASSSALEDLSQALLAYRKTGRLLGPDGGGDIPSVDEIRRSACRVQGRRFEKKVLERDARLLGAQEGAAVVVNK